MPTQPPLHVSVTQNSSEQRQRWQNIGRTTGISLCTQGSRDSPAVLLPLHPHLVQGRCWEVSPLPAYCIEIFAILMNPTYLEHINEIITETCPFIWISGKLPLNRLAEFLTSPDNIYLLIARYHHLQPLCHPTKERKALCPKPNDLSVSVLSQLRQWGGANSKHPA